MTKRPINSQITMTATMEMTNGRMRAALDGACGDAAGRDDDAHDVSPGDLARTIFASRARKAIVSA